MKRKRRVAKPISDDDETQNPATQIEIIKFNHKPSFHIPECLLIEEVFPRLPVKALLQYKSLSKQWNSVISSPQFIQLHLSLSSAKIRYLLIDSYGFVHIHGNCDRLTRFEGQIQTDFNAKATEPVGSINGLVCSVHGVGGSDYYFIWNPSTTLFRKITPPVGIVARDSRVVFRGFGYVSSVDDYKLVHATYSDETTPDGFVISLFSLRTGVWRHMSFHDMSNELVCCRFDDDYSLCSIKPGTALVNETLHWLGLALCCEELVACKVFAFDLAKEKMISIPAPLDMECDGMDRDMFVSVLDECLCLCNVRKSRGLLEMWVLEEYGDWESWNMLLKVDFGMGLMGSKLPHWNLFGGLEKKILVRPYGGNPHLFVDFSHDPPKMVSLPRDMYLSFGISYVETLVSPFLQPEQDSTIEQQEDTV